MSTLTTSHQLTITGKDAILVLELLRDHSILVQPMLTLIVQKLFSSPRGSCHLLLRYSGGLLSHPPTIYINQTHLKYLSGPSTTLLFEGLVPPFVKFVETGGIRQSSPALSTRQRVKLSVGVMLLFLTFLALTLNCLNLL